jgi:hypothetical protein
MNDRASKTAVCCVGVFSAIGLTLHIFWGVALLAREGEWGNVLIILAAFIAAWTYLGLHLSRLPSSTRMRLDEATPHFTRVMLPFCVPSAITTGLLLSSGLLNLSTTFVMTWGLVLIVVVPVTIHACVWIRSRFAESEISGSQPD